jgi:hypothetical protein
MRLLWIALGAAGLLSGCDTSTCSARDGKRCEGDVVWSCDYERDGHAVEYDWVRRDDCAESSRTCVALMHPPGSSPSGDAFCAESAQPTPACDGVGAHELACDGSDLVQCYRGYATSREPCGTCEAGVCQP